MAARSNPPPSWKIDTFYRAGELALLVVFIVSAGIRGAATIPAHWVEAVFLGVCAALSQAFRIRISAVDEKLTLGMAAAILGLALPSVDLITTVLVWGVGLTAGAIIAERDLISGARTGFRSILAGLAYSTVLSAGAAVGSPLAVSVLVATLAFLAISLLLARLPGILADDVLAAGHLIPRRIVIVFVLNAAIPIITHYAEPTAYEFILSDAARMKLIMDLTVTTSVFSVLALIAYGYEARHRLDGVIRTARALPWPDHPDPLAQMKEFAGTTLRADRVEIRSTPPRSRFEIGTPFRTHTGEERYLVALRDPGRSPLLDRDLQALSAVAHIGQETMRVRGEANELRTEANTDPLTGLFNYRGFQAAIADVGSRRQEQSGAAVVYIDLDGFKGVNDKYGHEAGNDMLREVARRLQEAVRPRDAVARVGGDEFVILLRDMVDRAHAEQVASRIVASASSPVELGDHIVPIRLSEGLAFSDDPAETLDALVNEADSLMYAKRGRLLHGAGEPGSSAAKESKVTGRRAILASLITEGRIEVAYQPIVDATRSTVVGLEALVRGHHAAFGPIEPSLLVHEARRLGLLDHLTEQVLEHAFADVRRMQQVAPDLTDVHVNIELGQLVRGNTQKLLRDLSRVHPGVRLTVEMTENSLNLAGEDVLARLAQLRSGGMRLALDDFGQGYSTMLAIVELPFDALKIDRSLIANITSSAKSTQVIRSLARLCRSLDVDMIVEGVERDEERDVLLRLGAKYMQGYLFSQPESVDRLCERFAARGLSA